MTMIKSDSSGGAVFRGLHPYSNTLSFFNFAFLRLQKQQFEEMAAGEREAWQLQQQQKAAAKAAKHKGMACEVVWQLVQLAERMMAYRAATGGQHVPRKDWREWLAMFAAGKASSLVSLSA